MGIDPKEHNQVVEGGPEASLQLRTDISGYMPTRKSQKVCVSVLVKVLGESEEQDFLIDLALHITDTLDSILVGGHGLSKAIHQSGYQSLDESDIDEAMGVS